MKYFINVLKSVKCNSAHNVIYKTFAVLAVQRSRVFVMAHVISLLLAGENCIIYMLMRGGHSNFFNLTWYALHQWNTWKGELWRLVYNNFFSFLIISFLKFPLHSLDYIFKIYSIDLMHKSWSGPCILGNRNLRIVIGYSSRWVTNNKAQILVS